MRVGVLVAFESHNLKVVCSIQAPATMKRLITIILLVFSITSYSQIINYKSNKGLIIIDLDSNIINLYFDNYQRYNIINYDIYIDNNGNIITKYEVFDSKENKGFISICCYLGKLELHIVFKNRKRVYNIERL